MTRHANRRPPGRLLLALARLILDDAAFSAIACPAIADLQHEVQEAGDDPLGRARARLRGSLGFWRIIAVSPFLLPAAPGRQPFASLPVGRSGGVALAMLMAALFAALWPVFGWFVAGAAAGGSCLAVLLRWWHSRYPSALAPDHPLASLPDARINLSSIPVAGDIGGLIFVVGSVTIVLLGLPGVGWFVLGSAIGAGLVATAIARWRARHASRFDAGRPLGLR